VFRLNGSARVAKWLEPTQALDDLPVVLQESTIVPSLCDTLWTAAKIPEFNPCWNTTVREGEIQVDVHRITSMLHFFRSCKQYVRIIRAKLQLQSASYPESITTHLNEQRSIPSFYPCERLYTAFLSTGQVELRISTFTLRLGVGKDSSVDHRCVAEMCATWMTDEGCG